jgi:hypothetical protein
MKTTCTHCGKKYQQSEAYVNIYCQSALCMRCALIELTVNDDFDQEPDWFDIENAWRRSGEATPEELDEIAEEHRRYPDCSTDELYPGSEWCIGDSFYQCHCSQCQPTQEELEEEARRDAVRDFENSHLEAVEEDQARSEVTEREAEQARWDTEIAEQEAQYAIWEQEAAARDALWAREEEENAAFSFFWYRVVGFKIYYRFVSPILVGIMRFKKRWRQ